jgi:hypothetical protein
VCQAYWIAFDDMRPLAEWFVELDSLWPPPKSVAIPKEIETQVALGAFLCLIVARPDDPALEYWERRLTGVLENDRNADLTSMAATLLLFHFVWTVGDRGRARRLRDVLRTARSSPSITPIVTVIASTWGDFSYEYGFGGSLPRCLASLHEASELAAARGVPVYDASLFGGMAYCHLTFGKLRMLVGRSSRWSRR